MAFCFKLINTVKREERERKQPKIINDSYLENIYNSSVLFLLGDWFESCCLTPLQFAAKLKLFLWHSLVPFHRSYLKHYRITMERERKNTGKEKYSYITIIFYFQTNKKKKRKKNFEVKSEEQTRVDSSDHIEFLCH